MIRIYSRFIPFRYGNPAETHILSPPAAGKEAEICGIIIRSVCDDYEFQEKGFSVL